MTWATRLRAFVARWLGIQLEHDVYFWLDEKFRNSRNITVMGERAVVTSITIDRSGSHEQRGSIKLEYFMTRGRRT